MKNEGKFIATVVFVFGFVFLVGLFVGRGIAKNELADRNGVIAGLEEQVARLESEGRDFEDEFASVRSTNRELAKEVGASRRQVDAIIKCIERVRTNEEDIGNGIDGIIERLEQFERFYNEVREAIENPNCFYVVGGRRGGSGSDSVDDKE